MLKIFAPEINESRYNEANLRARRILECEPWRGLNVEIEAIFELLSSHPPSNLSLDGDTVTLICNPSPPAPILHRIETIALNLRPWRIGPFSINGLFIDSEWRSGFKWNRIAEALGDLSGKRVADVGCSSGYFLFRSLLQGASIALGFDRQVRTYLQFRLVQSFNQFLPVEHTLLSSEELGCFGDYFDLLLSMGVIYHQRNPAQFLKDLQIAIKPGGQLIIESIAIPGEQESPLLFSGTYAKAKNVRWLPTASLLKRTISESGFSDVKIIDISPSSTEEQRTTRYAPGESWADFTMPGDSTRTIEGHLAPLRVTLSARKPLVP